MGYVYTDITLMNAYDVVGAHHGVIPEPEVRQTTVQAMVDTGAATLVINDAIRQELGLELYMEKEVRLANNASETVKVADPIEVHWKNRRMVCLPWVMPGDGEILLGAIPLEEMDLIVDPKYQEVVGAHGEKEIGRV